MGVLRVLARAVSWIGLTAVGGIHLIWATGSPWPAKNRRKLALAVVGSTAQPPSAAPTVAVAGAALVGGAITAGVLGEGRAAVAARRLIGLVLLARGVIGGAGALRVLGMPPSAKRFLELDARYYRPLCIVLGVAALLGATPRRRVGAAH